LRQNGAEKKRGKFIERETHRDVAVARHRENIAPRLGGNTLLYEATLQHRHSSLHYLFRTAIKCASPSVPLRAGATSTTGVLARTSCERRSYPLAHSLFVVNCRWVYFCYFCNGNRGNCIL